MKSDRCHSPCNVCDVNGTLNGKKSFDKWKNHFTRKLKINLRLNVGIIGSGKLSEDYINIAKSFDHNINI